MKIDLKTILRTDGEYYTDNWHIIHKDHLPASWKKYIASDKRVDSLLPGHTLKMPLLPSHMYAVEGILHFTNTMFETVRKTNDILDTYAVLYRINGVRTAFFIGKQVYNFINPEKFDIYVYSDGKTSSLIQHQIHLISVHNESKFIGCQNYLDGIVDFT